MEPEPGHKASITVRLSKDARDILGKYQGEMSIDEFFDLVLRLLDSKAVGSPPPEVDPENE